LEGGGFDTLLKTLLAARAEASSKPHRRGRRLLRDVNILLVQLTNGLNISEAMECYYKFITTGARKVHVRLAGSEGRARLCIIPSFMGDRDIELTRDLGIPREETILSVASSRFKVKTRSLKYAFYKYITGGEADWVTVKRILDLDRFDKILEYFHETLGRRLPPES